MKIKCNDGIIRRFRPCTWNNPHYQGKVTTESICIECGYEFGIHDTRILKPSWKEHICKPQTENPKRIPPQ